MKSSRKRSPPNGRVPSLPVLIKECLARVARPMPTHEVMAEVGGYISTSAAVNRGRTQTKKEVRRGRLSVSDRSSSALAYVGRQTAVSRTLVRMAKQGQIVRVCRGVYALGEYPRLFDPEERSNTSAV